jgi:putative transposase
MLESDEEAHNAFCKATRSGRSFGSEAFIDGMEFQLNQSLRLRKPDRLKKRNGERP